MSERERARESERASERERERERERTIWINPDKSTCNFCGATTSGKPLRDIIGGCSGNVEEK